MHHFITTNDAILKDIIIIKNMYHIIKTLRVSDRKKVLKKFEKSETFI